MKLSDLSIKRPVTILMVCFIILILGVVSLTNLSVDLFPDIELPVAVTIFNYEGVGPEEIEQIITEPVEGVLSTLSGIENIQSVSSPGTSVVVTQFAWGTDMDTIMVDLRDKVNLIKAMFPEEVSEPMVMKMDMDAMPILMVGVTGQYDLEQLEKIVKNDIEPRLERIPGVASADLFGGKTREIQVEVDPYKLQAYNLTLNEIVNAIRTENSNTSVGYVKEGEKEYLVRVKGEFKSLDHLENVLIPLRTGDTLELKYLADNINDGYAKNTGYALLNGKETLAISIQKQSDANTVAVSEEVNKVLVEIEKEMDGRVSIVKAMDQADFINASISNVAQNGYLGAILAALILFLFLRNVRSTLIIGIAIPISIITTFVLMYFGKLTLNIISLGGLALGVGMMVDNSIVILENIYRYRQNGYSRMEAAKEGAQEVASAIIASTLTTVAVFLPIVFVKGIASQIFTPMALTVSFSLFASLMVALTLVPMLSSKYLKVDNNGNGGKDGLLKKISNRWLVLLNAIDAKYKTLLKWSLNRKKTVIFVTTAIFIGSLFLIPFVGMEFIPETDSGMFRIDVELPVNSVLERTEEVIGQVEQIVAEIPEVKTIFTMIGSTGMSMDIESANKGTVNGELVPLDQRNRSIDQVLDEIRQKTENIPGAKISVRGQSMSMSSSPISLTLKGDELDVLEDLANQVAEKVREVPGTREVSTSLEEGSPEISLNIDRQKAAQYGVSTIQAAQSLRNGVQGVVASKYRTAGDEINIKVILPEDAKTSIEDLRRLMVPSTMGFNVPIEEIAEIEYSTGPVSITRDNQSRQVTVSGSIFGRDLNSVTKDITAAIKDIPIPQGYSLEIGGSNKEMVEAFTSLAKALLLAIILVYMVMAAQFESLLYPFIIMFSIPPTFIGVVSGLFITGRTLSVPTFIGIIMLAGIVVNNAIVLVDYINTLRSRGMDKMEAILEAGPIRLRPILMTTLTTVLALVPMTMGIGEGAEVSAGMGTAVVFGLSFSTLITLVLVPVMYYILDELSKRVKNRKKKIFKNVPQTTES